ncbi:hypothetical protein [Halosolutus halophilus]|uniref:hypothetical protein n=1 Tax=Halosolutus halophilus TaxID=1552990 RepID=UPI002234F66C|nr:hypothetical protein [Halosolutus halophilus]
MTGGSYRITCNGCGGEIRASARYCPICGDRQPWITDDGIQVGDRETGDEIDDVCSSLEALRNEVDHPEVRAALRSAVGHVWRASILQRADENSDVRLIADCGGTGVTIHGPDPVAYKRERGESR